MPVIHRLRGREILDSRGRPTVLAECTLDSGVSASASVPSGASTGSHEALELRDGDPTRYRGLGCRKAAGHISGVIAGSMTGKPIDSQRELDNLLTELDGTGNCSHLGANAMLAVSVAFARAQARQNGVPLYRHFARMAGTDIRRTPVLTINLFSGGLHAGRQVSVQDVLIVPVSAATIDDALAQSFEVYQRAAALCLDRYGMRPLVADEGGLAPPFSSARAMFDLAMEAITRAGFRPRTDFRLAVDVASTHFFDRGVYHLDARCLTAHEMIAAIAGWCHDYPIESVEDGLAEEDWSNWPQLRQRLPPDVATLGDDLLCTNPGRIEKAVTTRACDALLLKVNQIGTLTAALEALRLARAAGWKVSASVRSGETEDNWTADLAVGWQGDYFKNGSLTRSERLAKYNRLLEIEQELHS